jgi:RHS repeat-associated protein
VFNDTRPASSRSGPAGVGGRIKWRMAVPFAPLAVTLALTLGVVLPSPAAAAVVRLPTSHESATSPVPARGADLANARSYFGARYYRADLGRFTTVDPVMGVSASLVDPQRWNRYAYAKNNPIKYVDIDGRWPTRGIDVHKVILQYAFPRLGLFSAELEQMAAGGIYADEYLADPAHSYAHGMSDGRAGQSPADAQAKYTAWMSDWKQTARVGGGFFAFGIAAHAVAGTFAPPHRGFQPWYGYDFSFAAHTFNESIFALHLLPQSELDAMISLIRDDFYQVFGGCAYLEATGFLYSRPLKTGLSFAPVIGNTAG